MQFLRPKDEDALSGPLTSRLVITSDLEFNIVVGSSPAFSSNKASR
jgi:hypothetical protein